MATIMPRMTGWFKKNMRFKNRCHICGKTLEVGVLAWLNKDADTGKWKFRCADCHAKLPADVVAAITKPKSQEPTMEDVALILNMLKRDSPEVATHLYGISSELDGVLAEVAKKPVTKEELAKAAEPKVGSLEWLKKNAEWGN